VTEPVLRVKDLTIDFTTRDGDVHAVKGINFEVAAGECLGIVGESGSGKSQTALAIMGLLADNGDASGSVLFHGEDIMDADDKTMRAIRGAKISMIFQDPLTSLTPHMTVGAQLREVLALHQGLKGEDADKLCIDWLEKVLIPE
jgi:ABC-type microcin C transport system duplicated ATPase subunit YejF